MERWLSSPRMDIDVGNARELDTGGTGWIVGFSPWTLQSVAGLRHVPLGSLQRDVCIKWFRHEAGHESGNTKALSAGRTISLLATASSHFELDFSTSPDFDRDVRTVVLTREGDYAAWGSGLYHRWRFLQAATVITVRWAEPDPG
jgi:hypothetical protein